MKKIVITTPYVSTNRLYTTTRNGARKKTAAGKASAHAIGWEAKSLYHGEPMKGPLYVELDLFFKDKRKRDLDNVKGLIDALTGILWEDDSLIVELRIRKFIDKDNPRVEILCNRKK